MWRSQCTILTSFAIIYFIYSIHGSNASPYTIPHNTLRNPSRFTSATSITRYDSRVDTLDPPSNPQTPYHALLTRGNAYPSNKHGNVTLLSFVTSLVPGQAHLDLLTEMYHQVYETAANNIDAIVPLMSVAFYIGLFTFTVHVLGGKTLGELLLSLLSDIWISMAPISYSLFYIAAEGTVYWAEMRFSDQLEEHIQSGMGQM